MLDGDKFQELKIFVGGLHQDTTKEKLNEHFSQFGYADSYVMMDKATGRSRGFGFVNFRDPEDLQTVLGVEHVLDGVPITCSEYKGKGAGKGGHGAAASPNVSPRPQEWPSQSDQDERLRINPEMKVFVGGLSQETTKESLNAHFSHYGEVDSYVMMDKATGRSRGFGFVNFRDFDSIDGALQDIHEVDGVTVAVTEYQKGSGKGCYATPSYGAVTPPISQHRNEVQPYAHPAGGHGPVSISRYSGVVRPPVQMVDYHAQPQGIWTEAPVTDELKIFVGGLSQETTKDTLNYYFSQYGAADAYIMMDRGNGRSRGFGFVNFKENRVKQSVIRSQPHMIDGCMVECRDYAKGSGKGATQFEDASYQKQIVVPPNSVSHHQRSSSQEAAQLLTIIGEQLQVLTSALTRCQDPAHSGNGIAADLQLTVSSVINALKPVAVATGVSLPDAPSTHASGGFSTADSHLKIFVGGLSQESTKQSLDDYFNGFGVADSYIMKDKATGRSRGFGFVNFKEDWVKNEVLQFSSHIVDGVPITCSDYQKAGDNGRSGAPHRQDGGLLGIDDSPRHHGDSREIGGYGPVQGSPVEDARIFLGGLAQSTSEVTLWEAFEPFGLVECEVMLDKSNGRSRGFGYLQFDSSSSAHKAIAAQPFVIDGKQVELKPCWGKGNAKGSGYARSSPYASGYI